MKKYYKVTNKKQRSCVIGNHGFTIYSDLRKKYSTKYFAHTNKRALNWGYGLTCFGSKRGAVKWSNLCNYETQVWECKIGKIMQVPQLCDFTEVNSTNIGRSATFDRFNKWPTGTVMTDKIKLIKRIK